MSEEVKKILDREFPEEVAGELYWLAKAAWATLQVTDVDWGDNREIYLAGYMAGIVSFLNILLRFGQEEVTREQDQFQKNLAAVQGRTDH
jgi:hypothetical protein